MDSIRPLLSPQVKMDSIRPLLSPQVKMDSIKSLQNLCEFMKPFLPSEHVFNLVHTQPEYKRQQYVAEHEGTLCIQ